MKLITLNVWGGVVRQPLLQFFSDHQDVDVFCLQEVYHQAQASIATDEQPYCLDILQQIQQQLPDHQLFFSPVVGDGYGLAIFYRKTFVAANKAVHCIHRNMHYSGSGPSHSRYLQHITFQLEQEQLSVINLHGLWNGKGKGDSVDRICQAYAIRRYIKLVPHPIIVAGDFNLRPDTKSMEIIAAGLVNLITDYNIQDTRTAYYTKSERYADYVLALSDLKVLEFSCLPEQVSDHAALKLVFQES